MMLDHGLREDASALTPDLVSLRHRLHRHPEVGLDLPYTQQEILDALAGLPLEISTGSALSSVTAVLRGAGRDGAAVLLRADMDGLPLTEDTGLEFASEIPGAMHACGHDLHTAMLVGAARLLAAHRDELPGDVVFMFQPGEEGHDGGGLMVKEGVLDAAGRRVSAAYGIHVFSAQFPRGVFTTRPHTLMAASDGLRVTVQGRGGHGSMPFLSKDPVVVAAQMVTALQTMVTRQFDVFDPVVITVGTFHAGTRRNIIPAEATFEATIRTFSAAARDRVCTAVPSLCEHIAAGNGLTADVHYIREYPATVNDPTHAAFVADTVRNTFGPDRFLPLEHPSSGSEDFSRVLAEVPGCYVFLGAHVGDDPASCASNHSGKAMFSDDVIPDGVLLHAQLAFRALERAT